MEEEAGEDTQLVSSTSTIDPALRSMCHEYGKYLDFPEINKTQVLYILRNKYPTSNICVYLQTIARNFKLFFLLIIRIFLYFVEISFSISFSLIKCL